MGASLLALAKSIYYSVYYIIIIIVTSAGIHSNVLPIPKPMAIYLPLQL